MSEMIERVALATCSLKPCICKNRAGFEGMPCLERGRKAIEAMRMSHESDADTAVGMKAHTAIFQGEPDLHGAWVFIDGWNGAITAALSEDKS